jgi:1A family penicillin-binding protein
MKIRKLVWISAAIVCGGIGLALAAFFLLMHDLPSPDQLGERFNSPSVRIADRNGRLLYEVLADSSFQDSGRHVVVALSSIPLPLRQATIATEDQNFYSHPGVDLAGIARAARIDLRSGRLQAGGSTITQQVARNLLMDAGERADNAATRRLQRKLREMVLAWQLTRRYSKDQILEVYLNQTYYGGMAYGVEAAAQTFFGKPVSELDLAEAALLAGLPQAPALYNPFTDPDAAKSRQQVVLGLMQAQGEISGEQRALAAREPLVYASTPYPVEAPHFVMMVRSELDALFTPEQIYQHGGLVVRTTLDLDWQKQAEQAVQRQIEALQRSPDGLGHNVNDAALVALDPWKGDILALVGSPDYFDSQIAGAINMAISPRQPGSSIKPLVYAAALDPTQTDPWTAATMLLDVRTSFVTNEGEAYTPVNYDSQEHGPVLVRQALASSLNIPAVITLDHIGMQDLFDLAGRLGITTFDDPQSYDLSLALGGGEVSLLELTSAYGAFANGGFRVQPQAILDVRDAQGDLLYQPAEAARERVLDRRVAWLISDILSDNEARSLGFGPNSALRLDRPAAVKTGTTSNFHDNWTIGYTPDLVVGVWTGNSNYEPMQEVNGLTGAAPIWHQFMRSVLTGRAEEPFQRPPGLAQVEICALSGLLPSEDCAYRRSEWFIEGTAPRNRDTVYQRVVVDSATGALASSETPSERQVSRVVLDLPPRLQPWARAQGLVLLSDLQLAAGNRAVFEPGGSPPSLQLAEQPLYLLRPPDGGVYLLASGLDAQMQQLHLEAVGEPGLQDVTLWVDGVAVARFTVAPFEAWWPLSIGAHRAWATAVRANGEQISTSVVTFQVR